MSITLRKDLNTDDPRLIRAIVEDTGFFRPDEISIAVELVEESLAKPDEYSFLLAEDGPGPVGYACFSRIPGTSGSYEIYWLAVLKEYQQLGIGRKLLASAEEEIKHRGGGRIYISTSGTELYRPTRAFYLKCGYEVAATLKDYYRPGDDQLTFLKII